MEGFCVKLYTEGNDLNLNISTTGFDTAPWEVRRKGKSGALVAKPRPKEGVGETI